MPLEIDIPGFGYLKLFHLVSDFNGTLALDGRLLPGVRERIFKVSALLEVHVVTADTFGLAAKELQGLPVDLFVLRHGDERSAKAHFVASLDGGAVILGNGSNDLSMMEKGMLSIAVLGKEGLYLPLITKAHVLVSGPVEALELLLRPDRLKATLRS